MKLNTDIISFNLPGSLAAEIKGIREKTLHLGRPEYYLGRRTELSFGHLSSERRASSQPPEKLKKAPPSFASATVYICPITWRALRMSSRQVKIDLPRLFNMLTSIYNKSTNGMRSLSEFLTQARASKCWPAARRYSKTHVVLNASFQYSALGYSSLASAE